MISQKQIRRDIPFTDVPLETGVGELLEDDLLNDDNIQTYHTNPFLHAQPNYHIYIPKEATPTNRCCHCDPLLLGMSLMLVFVLFMVFIVLFIIKN